MKTIEEKARAYDEALEKAREYWETDNDNTLDIKAKGTMEYLFPELAEGGDEIIKKELINYLKHRCNSATLSGEERACNKWIDWLEKQGEPKQHLELKAGNWYICHRAYCCRADHLTVKEGERFQCEKDGIVKGFVVKEPEKYFKECSAPATTECNLGSDDVRRRSTIQVLEHARSLDTYNQYGKADIDKNITWLEKQEQKPKEWSEDDEQYLLVCKNALRKYQITNKWDSDIISRWLDNKLKSLRPQINVTDKELAQARIEAYNETLDKIEYNDDWPTFNDGWDAAIWYLKKRNGIPQNRWNPSDGQIKALKEACDKSWEPDGLDPLYTLYEDLKKLKAE